MEADGDIEPEDGSKKKKKKVKEGTKEKGNCINLIIYMYINIYICIHNFIRYTLFLCENNRNINLVLKKNIHVIESRNIYVDHSGNLKR